MIAGVAVSQMGARGEPILHLAEAVSQLMLKMTGYVMYLAPIAALAAIAAVLAVKGPELLYTYGKFIISFYLTILVLWMLLLLIASLFVGRRVIDLVISIKDMILLAFSTASSEAAFPRLIPELENFGGSKFSMVSLRPIDHTTTS